jgi:hypothetical protein
MLQRRSYIIIGPIETEEIATFVGIIHNILGYMEAYKVPIQEILEFLTISVHRMR